MDSGDDRSSTAGVGSDWTLIPGPACALIDRRRLLPPLRGRRTIALFGSPYAVSALKEDRVERRLAAILAADVAGYSRLMGIDEEGTLAALKGHRRVVIDPKITEHRGRIVKTTGDGVLVEFASVVDAVRCAVDIQRLMAERNAAVPQERRIEFRIGLNVGDIIIDNKDIYGDGVNIAARLEALAAPGGICVSRVVRDQVRDKLDFSFEDMGEQQVKNISRPVRTHRILLNPAAVEPILVTEALFRRLSGRWRRNHRSQCFRSPI